MVAAPCSCPSSHTSWWVRVSHSLKVLYRFWILPVPRCLLFDLVTHFPSVLTCWVRLWPSGLDTSIFGCDLALESYLKSLVPHLSSKTLFRVLLTSGKDSFCPVLSQMSRSHPRFLLLNVPSPCLPSGKPSGHGSSLCYIDWTSCRKHQPRRSALILPEHEWDHRPSSVSRTETASRGAVGLPQHLPVWSLFLLWLWTSRLVFPTDLLFLIFNA